MAKYSIDQAVLAAQNGRRDSPAGRRLPVDNPSESPKASLLQTVAKANRCRTIWHKELGMRTVVGFQADLDAVELLFTSLLVQANAAMLRAGAKRDAYGRSRTRAFRQAFLIAHATRIGERFSQATEHAEQQAATVSSSQHLLPVLRARQQAVDDYRKECAMVLERIATANPDCVIALPPSGLRDAFLRVVRRVPGMTVAVHDTPENILERITFYDIDSRRIEKHLTEEEQMLYLKEIKAHISYFKRSYYQRPALTRPDRIQHPSSAAHSARRSASRPCTRTGNPADPCTILTLYAPPASAPARYDRPLAHQRQCGRYRATPSVLRASRNTAAPSNARPARAQISRHSSPRSIPLSPKYWTPRSADSAAPCGVTGFRPE